MAQDPVKLRGVYGKPLSKAAGTTIALTSAQLMRAGDIILASIKTEIKRDIAKAAGLAAPGKPIPLPRTPKFVDSFTFTVKGQSTLEFRSTWPTAQAHLTDVTRPDLLENERPENPRSFEMKWLSQPAVPFAQIVTREGEVIVRTTPNPNQGEAYWVHPGFRKYTFLERGLRKGRELVAKEFAEEILTELLKTHDLFGG